MTSINHHQPKDENEIMELVYMGKAIFRQDPETHKLHKQNIGHTIEELALTNKNEYKEYRQFMVRRKKHLEMIYTNGIIYWVDKIHGSQVNPPFCIQDIMVS